MNNLKLIMRERNISVTTLAELTGISKTNIRRLCEDDNISYAHKPTLKKLSMVLGVKETQLTGNDNYRTGDKGILYKSLLGKACDLEYLIEAYSDEPLECFVSVDSESHTFSFVVRQGTTVIMNEHGHFQKEGNTIYG